jgi:hypothetical protein
MSTLDNRLPDTSTDCRKQANLADTLTSINNRLDLQGSTPSITNSSA